jgi:hypothetical protein
MLWLFAATPTALRAALPTWVDALPEPVRKEMLDPYTRERITALTYNPDPDGDYEDPPEEAPPPFPHATIWEPEGRFGWIALYEIVTGDAKLRLEGGEPFEPDSNAARFLYREVLCGRPGSPSVCHVADDVKRGLLRITSSAVPDLARQWVELASKRFTRRVDVTQWLPHAEDSLRGIERWAATLTDREAPWFVWEDPYDW